MTARIYLITNKVNGKRYVGITTKSVEKRWRLHINTANDDSYYWIHKAIRKYGPEAFEVEELGAAATWETACQIEIALIAFFKTFWLDGRGYNQTHGGDGNAATWTEERKERHSKRITESCLRPERREQLRQIALGNTNRRYKATKPLTFNGETLSARQWAERLGLPISTIQKRVSQGWDVERILTTPRRAYAKKEGVPLVS